MPSTIYTHYLKPPSNLYFYLFCLTESFKILTVILPMCQALFCFMYIKSSEESQRGRYYHYIHFQRSELTLSNLYHTAKKYSLARIQTHGVRTQNPCS